MTRSRSCLVSLTVLVVAASQLVGCADFRASRTLAPASTLAQGNFAPRKAANPHLVLVCETRGISSRTCRRQSLQDVNEHLIESLSATNPHY